jgi:hypothetical protein
MTVKLLAGLILNGTKCEYGCMDFVKAIEKVKDGYNVRRSRWPEGLMLGTVECEENEVGLEFFENGIATVEFVLSIGDVEAADWETSPDGLTWDAAYAILMEGKRIRRKAWREWDGWFEFSKETGEIMTPFGVATRLRRDCDAKANDWEVVGE